MQAKEIPHVTTTRYEVQPYSLKECSHCRRVFLAVLQVFVRAMHGSFPLVIGKQYPFQAFAWLRRFFIWETRKALLERSFGRSYFMDIGR